MRILTLLALIVLSVPVFAGQVTINYALAADDCDGQPVDPADYTAIEFYFSIEPIPASDMGCVQNGSPPDVPPTSTPIVGDPSLNSVSTNIPDGLYYIRGRVQLSNGQWSQLSAETQRQVTREPMVLQILL